MKHQALTEEEIAKSGLLPEGTYDFTIVEANEYTNDKGTEVFKLKLHVFDAEGETRIILDWLTASYPKKFKHMHDACGLLDLYAKGNTQPQDVIGKSGKLILGIGEPYKDKNGIERINNSVVDYVKRDGAEAPVTEAKVVEELDDSIPF